MDSEANESDSFYSILWVKLEIEAGEIRNPESFGTEACEFGGESNRVRPDSIRFDIE